MKRLLLKKHINYSIPTKVIDKKINPIENIRKKRMQVHKQMEVLLERKSQTNLNRQ